METERVDIVDGLMLRDLMRAGLAYLEQNKEQVNALNVFPVPDGDTGTNMWHTMRAVADGLLATETAHAGDVAQSIAHSALMGSRGNSGVILSEIWNGFAQSVASLATVDVPAFAKALRHSAEIAPTSVENPTEGTILTIIRAMADSAASHAPSSPTLASLLTAVLKDANTALANTPNQLPILKQAGVVDSGGQGLIYIFEGMLHHLNGDLTLATTTRHHASRITHHTPNASPIKNPYDVQFILQGSNLNIETIRQNINAMGDSGVIVGDSTLIKVHIHVQDPGQPLSYGASLGSLSDVVIENMQLQIETLIADEQPSTIGTYLLDQALQPHQIGLVATAAGAGIANVLRSLGVTVVSGGQSNNPSTEEIFAAIENVPSERVVILPNNKNIVLAASSAAKLSTKTVVVVPTRSVPQGIAALVAYDANGELDAVADAMQAAIDDVVTGEITVAVRDVEMNEVRVKEGEIIGLVDDKLCVSAETVATLIPKLLSAMEIEHCELLTLYYGANVSSDEATALAATIESDYPELEIEILSGGQPHYDYILGAE